MTPSRVDSNFDRRYTWISSDVLNSIPISGRHESSKLQSTGLGDDSSLAEAGGEELFSPRLSEWFF